MIKIKVPATTANLGAGFDTFGLALSLYNEFFIEESHRFTIETNPKDRFLENPENNLFIKVLKHIYSRENKKLPPLHIRQITNIPVARGLGSSATAITAGILAGFYLLDKPLTEEEFFDIAYRFEPHPDNLLPSWKGNFITAVKHEKGTVYQQIDFPTDIKAVVLTPEIKLSTQEARQVLPKQIPLEDAVFNIQRASLFISALMNKNYKLLKIAMEDKLHQPYRKKLIPCFDNIVQNGYEEGALGVSISGAGTSIVALATENFENIGKQMLKALNKCKIKGNIYTLNIDKKGAILQTANT
ncbi:MAG: homoserine kinase [Aquificae bacterium]|nr:homoserine kinase [Aquificota bacterium]